MIQRPWHLWGAFTIGLLIVFAALGGISHTAIKTDRAHAEDQASRLRDEKLHVALWRMDAAMQTIITRESVRPHASYLAFHPIGTAFDNSLNPSTNVELIAPSPLLTERPSHVRLHFLFDSEGNVSSPQNPIGRLNDVAARNFVSPDALGDATSLLASFAPHVDRGGLLQALPDTDGTALDPRVPAFSDNIAAILDERVERRTRNRREWNAREQSAVFAANQASQRLDNNVALSDFQDQNARHLTAMEGGMHAIWVNEFLLLARRVRVGSDTLLEGCWLNWDTLEPWLLSQVSDLAPGADLVRDETSEKDGTRHLASLPVRLVPPPLPPSAPAERSAVGNAVLLAWVAVLLAAVVVALVLRQAITLMERRGTFVSAVTHEMRTPLTTFRLYTDLLASGHVTDQARTHRYVETLRSEANRLSHLVENVLGYSRLERGRHPERAEIQDTAALAAQIQSRLEIRTRQFERPLRWTAPEAPLRFRADLTTVEQILANLVDNACKYGTPAVDPTIEVRITGHGAQLFLDVIDHGPGITAAARKRLFRAFAKSAEDAAHSAPGIGLGLAFSRRLARRLGGDLVHVASEAGCTFRLSLPLIS